MADRPNIVVAMTDTQGWEAIGEAGDGAGYVDTPRIDQLAEEGVTCTRNYCTSPVCTPSRAGFFTGQYPHNTGAWTNNLPLGQTVRTMGEYLQLAGYRTGYVGKWHLDGTDYFGTGEAPPGYDDAFWYDGRNYLLDIDREDRQWWRSAWGRYNTEFDTETMRERGITREWTWAGGITDRAIDFIEECDDDRPYFLVVSYDEPHEPSVCPPEFADRYADYDDDPYSLPGNHEKADDLADKPDHHQRIAERYREGEGVNIDSISNGEYVDRPLYFACAEFVDDEIGRVLDAADEHAPNNTVFAFTSDHGHHLGAHGLEEKGPTMYDEIARVPLIFRGPGVLPEGVAIDGVTSHVDVLPTLLELAEADRPAALDGESMLHVLRDPTESTRDVALLEYHRFAAANNKNDTGYFPIRCAVGDEHKLVVNAHGSDELYDHTADSDELDNRIDDPSIAATRKRLHDAMLRLQRESRDPFYGRIWKDRPWRADGELTDEELSMGSKGGDGFLPPSGTRLIWD